MSVLLANAGVPMLGVQMGLMVLALIPIVVVEGAILRVRLAKPLSQSLFASAIANLASTFVGLPLTWTALVCAELASGSDAYHPLETPLQRIVAVTLQAPWLGPYESDDLRWMTPAASLVLLVPFFFVSALVESALVSRLWKDLPRRRVRAATWIANALSYAGLVVYAAGWLLFAIGRHG